ncbi:caspase family protein [Streptomyces sp. NBC_00663]|uniref:caspase family protein n=1 Tax=Streptomyces sp. NBC_00663 TaxID=2975801 RepID=UPI002E34EF76|nr:caspase family protein [Streptomyces sp. NBC_00663]
MGHHRALLIGASDYEMRGIQPLPFIPGDLTRLGAVLTGHGFADVQVLARRPGGKQISANYINARVIGFLRRVRPGDTAFILLSGHGVHARGQDFLVPEDIDEDVHPFESGCVPIDWRRHLDETPADHVVFLIDACREGIEQDSMGVAGVREWGRQQISAALRRKVAYLYGCSPAQLSLFVRSHEQVRDGRDHGTRPGESFSIFSRSISDVVTAHPHGRPLALAEFRDAVQDRVTELHRAYGKKGDPQLLRVVSDIPTHDFYFLPRPGTAPAPRQNPSPWPGRDTAAMSIAAMPHVAPTPSAPAFGPPPTMPSPPSGERWRFRWPRGRRWTRRRKLIVALAGVCLTAMGGGLFGFYQWTQTQYYVGKSGDHLAVYRGIDDTVAGIGKGKVDQDHPEIELKYLPSYPRTLVEDTIALASRSEAQAKVRELAVQASACKKNEENQAGGSKVTLTKSEQQVVAQCGTETP